MTPSSETVTQAERGRRFRALHEREARSSFPIPTMWERRSCWRILGFEALATTSAGYAFTLGKRDGGLTREQALAGAVRPLPLRPICR